jgi:hypothetical protein
VYVQPGIAEPLLVAGEDVSHPVLDAVTVTVAVPELANPLFVIVLEVLLTEPADVEMLYVAGSKLVILTVNEPSSDVAEPRVGVVTFENEVPDVLAELDKNPFLETVIVHVAVTAAPMPATVTIPPVCVAVPAIGLPNAVNANE